jgi:hypothetical protein
MRTIAGTFICLAAFASLAFAAEPETTNPLPTYHFRGYYRVRDNVAVWQISDDSPWQVVKDEPWIKPRLTKWGYIPVIHDSEHYYCLIDDKPLTGSNIAKKRFICGDAPTVELNYVNGRKPRLLLYGAEP